MSAIDTPDGIRFAKLASLKGRLSLEMKGIEFKRGTGTTLRSYNEMFCTKHGRREAAYLEACERVDMILFQSSEDECYDTAGDPLPNGRCDTCGKPVFKDGRCVLSPDHEVSVDG